MNRVEGTLGQPRRPLLKPWLLCVTLLGFDLVWISVLGEILHRRHELSGLIGVLYCGELFLINLGVTRRAWSGLRQS